MYSVRTLSFVLNLANLESAKFKCDDAHLFSGNIAYQSIIFCICVNSRWFAQLLINSQRGERDVCAYSFQG